MAYQPYKLALTENQKQKLITAKKNNEAVALMINKNQMGVGDDVLYLTERQMIKLREAKSSKTIKLSKTQMSKQTGGFLGILLKALGSLALSGAAGAISGLTNQAVKNKMSGRGLTVHIPSDEVELIVESTGNLERENVLPRGTSEMVRREMSEQRGGFIGTLLAALLPSLLLSGKGLYRAGGKKKS